MKVTKENWPEVAAQIEKTLRDFLAQHLEDDEISRVFEEWRFRLAGSCMNYFDASPLFETNKKAKSALTNSRGAYEKFWLAVEKMPPFARLQLEQSLYDCEVPAMGKVLRAFNDAFDAAENSIDTSVEKMKSMDVSESQRELYACESLIICVLQIFMEATKRQPKISRSGIDEKPNGLLFDFVKSFVVVFEPNLKDETLVSRIKTAIKKLPLLTGE